MDLSKDCEEDFANEFGRKTHDGKKIQRKIQEFRFKLPSRKSLEVIAVCDPAKTLLQIHSGRRARRKRLGVHDGQ